jgi:tetratricopeptide (TPR) repeat protein
LDEIGRGGMGVVHRARDLRLGREVAVKLLLADGRADSPAAIRFQAEARITGRLQHPCIPAVHELGNLPDGRPFLAMKLVQGRTLQELLKNRPDPSHDRGRFLAIFEALCQAVGYAHAHDVIHRDLKPSNVMVGAFGEVQVMDWGLAKILGEPGTDRKESSSDLGVTRSYDLEATGAFAPFDTPQADGSATRTGSVLGTLAYMPPEQAVGEIRKLDARSDVFGLGAILCQLLTGWPPYVGASANAVRIQAVRGEMQAALAALDACGAEPALVELCRRCLAFQQEGRPADGQAVAEEVARIRQQSEALARKAEQERELVRTAEQGKRRRLVLFAGAAIVAVLLVGLAASVWQMNQAQRERDAKANALTAEEKARAEEKAAKEQAQKRLAQIEKSNEIITAIFTDLDIRAVRQGGEPLEAVLAKRLVKAAEQLDGEAVGDPLVVAGLQNRLGESLQSLGYPQAATLLFVKARATWTAALGADHPDTLACMNNQAEANRENGKLDQAVALHVQTLERRKATLGRDHPDVIASTNNLAMTYAAADKVELAIQLLQDALQIARAQLGPEHTLTVSLINNLAMAHSAARQHDLALPLYQEGLKIQKARHEADHPELLASMNNLATAYIDARQPDLAIPLLEETVKRMDARLGHEHPDTLIGMHNLAFLYGVANRRDDAIPLFEETLKRRTRKFGRDDPRTLSTAAILGAVYLQAGRPKDAIPLLEEADRADRQHASPRSSSRELVEAYTRAGEHGKLANLLLPQLPDARQALPKDSPELAGLLAQIGQGLLAQQRWSEAEPLLRECLAIRTATQPDAWTTFNTQSMLGAALVGQKKRAEAEPLLLKGYHGLKAREQAIPAEGKPRLTEALERLVQIYEALDRKDEAAKWRKELEELKAAPLVP